MPDTPVTDPTHPDFAWIGSEAVASKNEVADAVTHMKAWFRRELARLEGKPIPAAPVPVPVPVPAPAPAPTPSVAIPVAAEPDAASG